MTDATTLCPARADDAQHVAVLIDAAPDGVAMIDWAEVAVNRPGSVPPEIGAAGYARGEGDTATATAPSPSVSARCASSGGLSVSHL